MDATVSISLEFDDINSSGAADHDDIDFDISTPRDQPPMSDLDLPKDIESSGDKHCEIPSILITEPSSVNLDSLEEVDNGTVDVNKTQAETNDDVLRSNGSETGLVSAEGETVTGNSDGSDTKVEDTKTESYPCEESVTQIEEIPDGFDTKVEDTKTESYPSEESVTQKEENQVQENDRLEDLIQSVQAGKQDTETAHDIVVEDSFGDDDIVVEDSFGDDSNAPEAVDPDVRQEVKVSEMITNLHKSDSEEVDKEVTDEVDETVSLDNILMKDKSESDSDSEFDFDLPPAAANTSVVKPVQQLPTVRPPEPVTDSQSKQPNSVVSTAAPVPAVSHDSPSGTSSQSNIASSQSPVPAISQDHYTGSPTPQASSSGTQKPVAVIKPTAQPAQAPYIVPPPPDEGTQRVLESAQAEWDKVTTIQAGYKEADTSVKGAEPTVVQTVEPMSPHEFLQIMKQDDFSDVRANIKPAVERHGFSAFVSFLFGPPKLHRDLIDERDRVFCLAASQLSNDNSSHIRTLQTIYRCLTGSKFDCPRIGSHWEEIGFQGTDPATDLRGAGVLGLMNLLYLLKDQKKHQLASDIYRLSLHPTQNFPFCVMGINFSRIALQTLREGLLNKECNRRHEVVGVVNDFYVGLYLQMYQIWKGQGKTISDSGFVIKDIETKAKKTPRDVFKNLEEFLNKKTVVIKDKAVDLGGDNFTNVCDDGP